MTREEALQAVRETWATYQADASRAGRALVPSLSAYWEAVRAVPEAKG